MSKYFFFLIFFLPLSFASAGDSIITVLDDGGPGDYSLDDDVTGISADYSQVLTNQILIVSIFLNRAGTATPRYTDVLFDLDGDFNADISVISEIVGNTVSGLEINQGSGDGFQEKIQGSQTTLDSSTSSVTTSIVPDLFGTAFNDRAITYAIDLTKLPGPLAPATQVTMLNGVTRVSLSPTSATRDVALSDTVNSLSPDSASLTEDIPISIDVAQNDMNVGSSTIVFGDGVNGLLQPINGSVSLNANGTVLYTPDPNFSGPTDSFEYQICGLNGINYVETVSVTIAPDADQPTFAANDASGQILDLVPITTFGPSLFDTDGSESFTSNITVSGVPTSLTFSSTSGAVTNNFDGTWTIAPAAWATLAVTGTVVGVFPLNATIEVTDNNGVATDVSIFSDPFTVDLVPNPPPTITQTPPGDITSANCGSYPVSGICTDDGNLIAVTLDDSNGGVSPDLTLSTTCGATTTGQYTVTFNACGLAEGQVNVTSTIDDLANPPVSDFDIVDLDVTNPTITQTPPSDIGVLNCGAFPVSGSCTADGDSIQVTLDDSNAAISPDLILATTCGATTSGQYSVSFNACGLAQGAVTVESTINDGINLPVSDSDIVDLDVVTPIITQTPPSDIGVLNCGAFPVSGSCTADGDSIQVILDDSNAATSPDLTFATTCGATTSGQYSVSFNACGLTEGAVTVQSTINDGVNSPVTDSDIVDLDVTNPTINQTPPSDISVLNCGTFPVSGTCAADGDSIQVTLDDSNGGVSPDLVLATTCGATTTGQYSVSFNACGLAEGAVIVESTINDGVNSPVSDSDTIDLDITVPTITQTAPGDIDVLNCGTFPVSGTCSADGDSIEITLDDSDAVTSPDLLQTTTCGATTTGQYTASFNVCGLAEGSVIVESTIDDGVNSPVSDSDIVDFDATVPAIAQTPPSSIGLTNCGSFLVSGSCVENGDSIEVTLDDSNAATSPDATLTTTCGATTTGQYAVTFNACGLAEGSVTVESTIDDGINLPVSDSDIVELDITGSTISQTPPGDVDVVNCGAFPVSGSCSVDGDSIEVTLDDGDAATSPDLSLITTCGATTSGQYSVTFNACGLNDGPVTVESTINDGVNTPVSDSDIVNLDVTGPTITQAPPGNIDSANCGVFPVSGVCSADGDSIVVTLDDSDAVISPDQTLTTTCGAVSTGQYSVTFNACGLVPGPVTAQSTIDDGLNLPVSSTSSISRISEGQVGNTIWEDLNNNGVQDPEEPGVEGVSVILTYFGADGVLGGGDDEIFGEVTDANGNYLFTGLLPGNYNVSLDPNTLPEGFGPGFDEDGGEDASVEVTIGSTSSAAPTQNFGLVILNGEASVSWNGFCDQQNFISMRNTCSQTVIVEVVLFDSSGEELGTQTVGINGGDLLDFSVNAMPGFSNTNYGQVRLFSMPGGCIDGDMGLFAPIGERGQLFSFSIFNDSLAGTQNLFTLADGSESNACYSVYNTLQPSLNPADFIYVPTHWLQLVNKEEQDKIEFKVTRYSSNGAAFTSENVIVNPIGRQDIAAGHEDGTFNKYGIVEVSPTVPGLDYEAQLLRYGVDQTTIAGLEMSSFNIADNCSTGIAGEQYLTISKGAGVINWIELYNINKNVETVIVDIYSNTQGYIKSQEFNLSAMQSYIFSGVEEFFPGESGIARIRSASGSPLLTKSTSYLYDSNGSVIDAVSLSGRKVLGSKVSGSFNTYRNQINWLRLFNTGEEDVEIEISAYSQQNEKVFGEFSFILKGREGRDLDLNSKLNLDLGRIGRVELNLSSSDKVTGDIIRVQHGVDLSAAQAFEVFNLE